MNMIATLSGPQILLPLFVVGLIGFFVVRNMHFFKGAVFHFVRAFAVGIAIYALCVLGGNFDELRRWRNVKGLLFLTGGAPVTLWTVLGAGGGLLAFLWLLFPKRKLAPLDYEDSETFERGRLMLTYAEALAKARVLTQGVQHPICWGMVPLPHREAHKHYCIIGATGSGKTTHLKLLMRSVLPTAGMPMEAALSDRRAVVYDSKRNMADFLFSLCPFGHIYKLDPFDEGGVAWDIAADINDPASALEIATVLIPAEQNSSAPYFGDATRALLAGIIKAYIKQAPGKWTLRDVILGLRDPKRLKTILSIHKDTQDCLLFFEDERHFPAVLTTIMTKTFQYDVVAALWETAPQKISLTTHWRDVPGILILTQDDKHRAALDCINQVVFKLLTQIVLVMDDSDTRQNWFFLDELREAPRLDGLHTLLDKGREKGVCVALGFQSIPGLRDRYGEDLASELPGMCSNKTILRTDDKETAKWASEHFDQTGKRKSKTTRTRGRTYTKDGVQETESTSVNEEQTERAAVLPSEFMSIPQTHGSIVSYNDIPSIGAYSAEVSFETIHAMMKPASLKVKPGPHAFRRRPESAQYLEDWKPEDLSRLNLEEYPQLLNESREKPSPKAASKSLVASLPKKAK